MKRAAGWAGAFCALVLAAWTLAQGSAEGMAEGGPTPANRVPLLVSNAPDGELRVRAGERAVLVVQAFDPDADANGGSEAVWLSAAPAPGGPSIPGWLAETDRIAGPGPEPRLELVLAPPADAAPGRHAIEAGATDVRGLTSLATFFVSVAEPPCGKLEVMDEGACRRCPDNWVPDASRTGCDPCPAGTERLDGSAACAPCAEGLTSVAGDACGCGPAQSLTSGACVDCPPHTVADAFGDACVPCAPGTERPASADACTDCAPDEASPGGTACTRAEPVAKARSMSGAPAIRSKSALAADTAAPTIASANYAQTTVTLTLSEPVWAEAAPAASDFAVTEDGAPVAVSSVSAAADAANARGTVTLTLPAALGGSSSVSLTYTANALDSRRPRDAAGNRLGTQTVAVAALRTLTASFGSVAGGRLAEDAGTVRATIALDNPPTSGKYTGCGLRLAAGSGAGADDVTFRDATKTLKPGNGWRVGNARLLEVTDDALAEGDEALKVEAHCTGGDAGMAPPAAGLAARPVELTLADDESRTVTLALAPDRIEETAGATQVTVTATLDGEAVADLELPLTLSGTAEASDYTVAGTQRITIAAGSSSGTTVLTVTPAADADGESETVAVASSATGYAVTGAALTIAESAVVTVVAALEGRDSSTLSEDAGAVAVRLTLEPAPAQGTYKDCRLRLAPGSVADAADVAFPNRKRLKASGGWSAKGGLLSVVDDALAEGEETLIVEGHCGSSTSDADPPHTALASRPLTLTIADNDAPGTVTLSVDRARVGETLGTQTVRVTATRDRAAAELLTVALSLGTGPYTVTGTLSVDIPADATAGHADLAFTPVPDTNGTDDAVTVGGSAPGHAVTGTSLTITEPVLVGGLDLSGLGVALSVSPAAIREGTSGSHTVTATLTGAPVPPAAVAMVLAVGGTATEGTSHDYTLSGEADWTELTVAANDAHLTARTAVTVSTRADQADEGEETVTFNLSQVTWGNAVVALREPASATLTVSEAWEKPGAPSGVTAVPAVGDERHGLDVAWGAVTATPAVEDYTVRYRAVADPPAAWRASEAQPGLSAAVTGLAAGTRHEVRVAARNAAGAGAESGSVYARTADGDCTVGAPRVTTPEGDRSSTELDVTWEAAACARSTSIASYRVGYREDPEAENVMNPWSEETSAGLTAALAGLEPDTAYEVRVRAVATGGDKGAWSPSGKGRTALDARRPPRVAAPAVEADPVYGDGRLRATWTRVSWVDGDGAAQPIVEYQYRTRVAEAGGWTEPTDALATAEETTALTRTIAGFDAGTTYQVQVRAVNRMSGVRYPGKWSEPGRGRTWGVPDRVEKPSAYRTDAGVAVLWEAPDDGGSAIDDYDIDYKTGGSGGWSPHAYAGCGVGACATEATIAAPANKVRVRAENAVGPGIWSETAKVRTQKLLRVSYANAAAGVGEGASLVVTVRLDSAADRAVTVPLTKAGDADAYRLEGVSSSDAVTVGLGQTEQTFTLVALQDADNADETVTLGFGALPDGVLRADPASLAVSIDDDEASNRSPAFAGVAVTLEVTENAAAGTAVGAPVTAADPDSDALAYSLAGTDAGLFSIDAATGQISVGADTALDFEGAARTYALTVGASDSKDAAGAPDTAVDATIAVTVNVSDVNEAPSAPGAPALTGTAPGKLGVSWTEPSNTGPRITGYDVHYRASGETGWTDTGFTGTGTAVTIKGLAAGAAYAVRVNATNDEGTSGWSDDAYGNTPARVALTADDALPEIGADDAAVTATLTGSAEAAGGGTLEGAWLRLDGGGAETVLAGNVALTSGTEVTHAVSSSDPGERTYAFRVRHTLGSAAEESADRTDLTTEAMRTVAVAWRPQVVLSVEPDEVAESDGATTVTVTATLTGTSATADAKTVTVSVAGGTATAAEDFAAVEGFAITIPGGARSASGSFVLTPVADTADEGSETVSVSATAKDLESLTVVGTEVTLVEAAPTLTVTRPDHGVVTGTSGTPAATVIDCGAGGKTTCETMPESGTVVSLTAAAEDGYGFTGWTGDCTGKGSCSVTVTGRHTVGAGFVTLPGAPDAPTVAPVDDATLRVTWNPPTETGSGIVEYLVRHRPAGTDGWTESATGGPGATATVGGLGAGTRHEVGVAAVSAEGAGGFSATVEAVTLPSVSVSADQATPVIGADDAAVSVTLTGSATAAEGTLTGRWVEVGDGGPATLSGGTVGAMTSGTEYTATVSFDTPGARSLGLLVTHGANADAGEAGTPITVRWVPTVVLSVDPASVKEDGNVNIVTVTPSLSGKAAEAVPMSLTVRVGSGTATLGEDFLLHDEEFLIEGAAGLGGTQGTFELAVVRETYVEDAETVAVDGTATQAPGTPEAVTLPVIGTVVTIPDRAGPRLTVAKPANGRVNGFGIDCGGTEGTLCEATLNEGDEQTLTATAGAGFRFDGWTGDCSGTGTCTLTMDRDRAVGVTISAPERTLTVTAPSNGKVTGTAGSATVIDCGSDCTETVAHGTDVSLTATPASSYAFSAWSGACAASSAAACTVTLDADKTVGVTFAVGGGTAGACDSSVEDGCRTGTLNGSAHADTDTHHHWRCDGSGGGANSPKCGKAKDGCLGGSRTWSAGGFSCAGPVEAASSGQTDDANDGEGAATGSASFKCDDGTWLEQAGSTCSGEFSCGASENTCAPSGVKMTNTADTGAVDGQCAATEAAGCLKGTRVRGTDQLLQHGACGTLTNGCAGGYTADKSSTAKKNSWRCIGYDAAKRWSCQGLDGSKNWTCSHAGETESCRVPVDATDNNSCYEVTHSATDAKCFSCNAGHEKCGGDCVAVCGENAMRAETGCGCVCKTGYHLHEGGCAANPACSDPLVENTCDVGSPTNFANSAIHGECKDTKAQGCHLGDFVDPMTDTAPKNGVCGTAKNECNPGTAVNKQSVTGKDTWDCAGIAGSKNWECGGTAGFKTWDCKNGGLTQACSLPDPGTDDSSSEIVAASKAIGCFACKSGYVKVGDACIKRLTPNAGGPYTATYSGGTLPFGGTFTLYTANVSASATGGVPPYRFRWEGKTADSATAIYIFNTASTYYKSVSVTDSATPQGGPVTATATIYAGTSGAAGAGGAQGASEEPVLFEMSPGSELHIVWGEDSAITASSGDTAVIEVGVTSPEIRVTGVGVGETDVIVQTDGGELRLPVVVK